MSKLHWTAKDVFGLPGMPKWVNYTTIDPNGKLFIWEDKPSRYKDGWCNAHGRYERLPLEHNYNGYWRDSLLERPQEVKVGDFVKGWDGDLEPNDKDAEYGYIKKIEKEDRWPYKLATTSYDHVRVMNPPKRKE